MHDLQDIRFIRIVAFRMHSGYIIVCDVCASAGEVMVHGVLCISMLHDTYASYSKVAALRSFFKSSES